MKYLTMLLDLATNIGQLAVDDLAESLLKKSMGLDADQYCEN